MTDGDRWLILTMIVVAVIVAVGVTWATFMTWRLRRRQAETNKRINRLP